MKVIVEFDSMEEFESFRTSGRKPRTKREEIDDAAVAAPAAAQPAPAVTPAPSAAAPPPAPQTFTPPPVAIHGFPSGNSGAPPAPHPLVTAIIGKIDGAIASGQQADAVIAWFRQQIGPDAAQATLDQIKSVFIPRMSEVQLRQIAPQLGIQE